jgi:1,4-dihydroxy-2-naphthoate octaprenyltransferase
MPTFKKRWVPPLLQTARHKLISLFHMMRAQFLIGIFFPLFTGAFVAVSITDTWHLLGLAFVLITGLGLHIATNVYNDIYDTLQGADATEETSRNLLSGGSGLILDNPRLMTQMIRLARSGLLISFIGLLGLLTQVSTSYWLLVLFIYGLSAFLSKYYTAAPFKLGYRGLGEFFIWLSFGPLAVLLGALSQGFGIDPRIIPFMPLTGLTTLTILWFGQLMDSKNDQAAGKRGLVLRLGTRKAVYGYVVLHALILANLLWISVLYPLFWWISLVLVIVYFLILPKLLRGLFAFHAQPIRIQAFSRFNLTLYLVCSLLYLGGVILIVLH